jgi:hypothetical protein
VNNNQFGALYFINAPYKISDRHTAVIALVKNELFLDRRELCYWDLNKFQAQTKPKLAL